jgi:uncharacterized protein YggE
MTRVLIILSILLSSLGGYSQVNGNLLKVQGSVSLYAIPETMYVNIPIRIKDSLYENCSKKLTEMHYELRKKLLANGIEGRLIKSDGLNIREKTIWDKGVDIHDGYQGSMNVSIQLRHTYKKLNSIINSLKESSFKFGYDVSFKLSEEQKSKLLENAIELAIKDAKNKASIIAKNLNIKLIDIKEVNFGYSRSNNDILINDYIIEISEEYEAAGEKQLSLSINPRKININKTINVIWKIEQ